MVEAPTGRMKWLRNPIDNRYIATITVAIGITHFLAPARFEPINVKLGFAHARAATSTSTAPSRQRSD